MFAMQVNSCLRLVALGGLHEVGKNMWVFESVTEDQSSAEYLVLDAGILYPGHDAPGVDYVFPEHKFLDNKLNKIRALVVSSVHESHSGGAHHLIKRCGIKRVVGSRLALEIIKLRLEPEEVQKIEWINCKSREKIELGTFSVIPFRISSCSDESFAFVIEAQGTSVFYSGTYKLDQTPIEGIKTDMAGITAYTTSVDPALGDEINRVVDLYIGDSANVEMEGYSSSDRELMPVLWNILQSKKSRIIFNTYNSNTIRIRMLFKLAEETGRKIALLNDDAKEICEAMKRAGCLSYADDRLINIRETGNYKDEELLIICSAPEGEAIRELTTIAYDKSLELQLRQGDVVVNSADLPAGTVRVMAQIADQLFLKEVSLIGGRNAGVHAHSHALTEEMKFMFNLIRPKFFLPAMGESRHLVKHAKLAVEAGFNPTSIFMLDNGDVMEIKQSEVQIVNQVETGEVMFNHKQDFHVDDKIIKERESVSREGLVMVSFCLNKKRKVVSGPVFTARACTFSRNKEWRAFCLMNTPSIIDAVDRLTLENPKASIDEYQALVREYMNSVIKQQIGKKPAVVVFANEI